MMATLLPLLLVSSRVLAIPFDVAPTNGIQLDSGEPIPSEKSAPIKERSFIPMEDVPFYTTKLKPTTKARDEARPTAAVVVDLAKRVLNPGDGGDGGGQPTKTHTKTKTKTRTTRTGGPTPSIFPLEERQEDPETNVNEHTPYPTTSIKNATHTKPSLSIMTDGPLHTTQFHHPPFERRTFAPITDEPGETPLPFTTTKTKSFTRVTTKVRTIRGGRPTPTFVPGQVKARQEDPEIKTKTHTRTRISTTKTDGPIHTQPWHYPPLDSPPVERRTFAPITDQPGETSIPSSTTKTKTKTRTRTRTKTNIVDPTFLPDT